MAEFWSSVFIRIREGSTSVGLSSGTSSLSSTGLVAVCSVNKVLFVFMDLRTLQSTVLWEAILWKEHWVLVLGFCGRGFGNLSEGFEVDGWYVDGVGLGRDWGVWPLGAFYLSIAKDLWNTLSRVVFSNNSTSRRNWINKPATNFRISTSSGSRMCSNKWSLEK